VPRISEYRGGRTGFDDRALEHDNDVVREVLDHGQVVRDEEVGQPKAPLQIQQQVDDPGLDGDVQGRHWLVERQDLRLKREGPCDADALLLPAGELGRIPAGVLVAQADHLQQFDYPFVDALPGEAVGGQRFCQHIEDGQAGVK
jgi:hypothetical protein